MKTFASVLFVLLSITLLTFAAPDETSGLKVATCAAASTGDPVAMLDCPLALDWCQLAQFPIECDFDTDPLECEYPDDKFILTVGEGIVVTPD